MAKNTVTASRPFKIGMLFALPLITLIVAVTHHKWVENALKCYETDQTCKAFAVPVTSTLHGVLSPRLPNHIIKYASGEESTEINILDVVKMESDNLNSKVFDLFTKSIAGAPFIKSSGTNISHFNTKCNKAPNLDGLGKPAGCMDTVRQSYAAYALDCYEQDTMLPDYTVSPACKCLQMFQVELYGVLNEGAHQDKNTWTHTEDSAQYNDLADAVLYCSARNEHSYTAEYAGVMNTYGLAVNGMLFLAWGLFSILTRMVTEKEGQYKVNNEKYRHENHTKWFFTDNLWVVFAGVAHVAIILLILIYSLAAPETYKEVEPGHAIMQLRTNEQSIDGENVKFHMPNKAYLEATKANEDDSHYMSTQGLTRAVFFVGWLLQVAVLVAWGFCYFASVNSSSEKVDQSKWRTYVPVLARVGTDLPLIVGFTLLGVSVMLQNGHTNYSFLDYNLFVILTICLLQHVSNVTKLFYDAVCRRTKSDIFKGMQYIGERIPRPPAPPIYDAMGRLVVSDGVDRGMMKTNEELSKKVTTVLQFFGWIRVWIFLLVTTFCVLLLTGTNELAKSLPIGNFTQSQVFVFVLALFLSNVTYDMVRELLPVQFEKHDADSARLYIITAYVLYYVVNQRLFIDKMNA